MDKKRQFSLILHQRRNLFFQNVLCSVEERWGVVRALRAFVRLVDVVLLVVLRSFGYDVQRRHLRFVSFSFFASDEAGSSSLKASVFIDHDFFL